MKLYFIIITLALFVFSCKKEDENVSATISIVSPLENDTIAFGQPIHLEGTVTGSAEMHGYSVAYISHVSGNTVYSNIHDVHSVTYTINESWTNNVIDTARFTIAIEVEKDHDGNMEKKELTVVCLPQ